MIKKILKAFLVSAGCILLFGIATIKCNSSSLGVRMNVSGLTENMAVSNDYVLGKDKNYRRSGSDGIIQIKPHSNWYKMFDYHNGMDPTEGICLLFDDIIKSKKFVELYGNNREFVKDFDNGKYIECRDKYPQFRTVLIRAAIKTLFAKNSAYILKIYNKIVPFLKGAIKGLRPGVSDFSAELGAAFIVAEVMDWAIQHPEEIDIQNLLQKIGKSKDSSNEGQSALAEGWKEQEVSGLIRTFITDEKLADGIISVCSILNIKTAEEFASNKILKKVASRISNPPTKFTAKEVKKVKEKSPTTVIYTEDMFGEKGSSIQGDATYTISPFITTASVPFLDAIITDSLNKSVRQAPTAPVFPDFVEYMCSFASSAKAKALNRTLKQKKTVYPLASGFAKMKENFDDVENEVKLSSIDFEKVLNMTYVQDRYKFLTNKTISADRIKKFIETIFEVFLPKDVIEGRGSKGTSGGGTGKFASTFAKLDNWTLIAEDDLNAAVTKIVDWSKREKKDAFIALVNCNHWICCYIKWKDPARSEIEAFYVLDTNENGYGIENSPTQSNVDFLAYAITTIDSTPNDYSFDNKSAKSNSRCHNMIVDSMGDDGNMPELFNFCTIQAYNHSGNLITNTANASLTDTIKRSKEIYSKRDEKTIEGTTTPNPKPRNGKFALVGLSNVVADLTHGGKSYNFVHEKNEL